MHEPIIRNKWIDIFDIDPERAGSVTPSVLLVASKGNLKLPFIKIHKVVSKTAEP